MEKKNAWDKYPSNKREEIFAFAEAYRSFISDCKTERECTAHLYAKAKEAGFADLDELIASSATLKAGDKVVANNMGKGLARNVRSGVWTIKFPVFRLIPKLKGK